MKNKVELLVENPNPPPTLIGLSQSKELRKPKVEQQKRRRFPTSQEQRTSDFPFTQDLAPMPDLPHVAQWSLCLLAQSGHT
jgi:hypothetical protein